MNSSQKVIEIIQIQSFIIKVNFQLISLNNLIKITRWTINNLIKQNLNLITSKIQPRITPKFKNKQLKNIKIVLNQIIFSHSLVHPTSQSQIKLILEMLINKNPNFKIKLTETIIIIKILKMNITKIHQRDSNSTYLKIKETVNLIVVKISNNKNNINQLDFKNLKQILFDINMKIIILKLSNNVT